MPLQRAAAILRAELTMRPFPSCRLNDPHLSALLLSLLKSNYLTKLADRFLYNYSASRGSIRFRGCATIEKLADRESATLRHCCSLTIPS